MDEAPSMVIKYWGVRGSIPSPLTTEQVRVKEIALLQQIQRDGGIERLFGASPAREAIAEYLQRLPLSISGTYGGNTTCAEVQVKDSPLIMIDAGTGARLLGRILAGRLFSSSGNLNPLNTEEEYQRQIHQFFTHYHWDHIQGLPFFDPAFIPGDAKIFIKFYGKKDAKVRLSHVLGGQQQYPNFPVVWEDMPCDKDYQELPRLSPFTFKIGQATVTYQELTHPDSVFAYSISLNGKKFVFATDNEHKDVPDPRLVRLAKDADILYFDAQYDPEGYIGDPKSVTGPLPKIDWGHSTYEWGVRNSLAAGVKALVLGHHEPRRDDFGIELILERALRFRDEQLRLPENEGKKLEIVLASEGLEQRL